MKRISIILFILLVVSTEQVSATSLNLTTKAVECIESLYNQCNTCPIETDSTCSTISITGNLDVSGTISGGSSVGYWDKTGTDLSPTTAGDDVVLGSGENLTVNGSVTFNRNAQINFLSTSDSFTTNNAMGLGSSATIQLNHFKSNMYDGARIDINPGSFLVGIQHDNDFDDGGVDYQLGLSVYEGATQPTWDIASGGDVGIENDLEVDGITDMGDTLTIHKDVDNAEFVASELYNSNDIGDAQVNSVSQIWQLDYSIDNGSTWHKGDAVKLEACFDGGTGDGFGSSATVVDTGLKLWTLDNNTAIAFGHLKIVDSGPGQGFIFRYNTTTGAGIRFTSTAFGPSSDEAVTLGSGVASFGDAYLGARVIYDPESITATSGGVAAPLTTSSVAVTTNGDSDLDNVTLADGVDGQEISIYCIVEGNAADTWKITPDHMIGGTQITFSGAGEGCILEYNSSVPGWVVKGNNGGTIS